MGFNKTEFTAREFQEHLQVKSTRPLSDITWSTLVEPALRKVLEANRRKRLEKAIARQYESVVKDHTDKAHLPPPAVYVQLSSLSSLVSDVSRNPPDSLIVPASIKAAAMEQALKLVRNRREKLARAVVKAYLSLSEQETERTEARRDGGEEEEIENSHTKLTPIRQLSFTLPLLPSWIPRDQNESITASDEQVATFLNISPLARFECVECHNSFDTQGLFAHFWPPQRLRDSNWIPGFDFTACKDNRSVSLEEWISVEGFDDNVERPLVRINPEVLSLSLKLNQLFESTPLVVDPSVKLPKLRGKYSIKAKKSESLKIELRCDCPVGWRRYSSPESMVSSFSHTSLTIFVTLRGKLTHFSVCQHDHVSQCRNAIDIDSHRVRSFVDYTFDYYFKYEENRRIKVEDQESSRGRNGSSSDGWDSDY